MKKLFFLLVFLCSLNSLHAFWPFSSTPQTAPVPVAQPDSEQKDEVVKSINKLVNRISELEAEVNQKDDRIKQLKRQVKYFATAYFMLCETFDKQTNSLSFNKAFAALNESHVFLDNDPQITPAMELATENVRDSMEQVLHPFQSELKIARQKELKESLITVLPKQKNSDYIKSSPV